MASEDSTGHQSEWSVSEEPAAGAPGETTVITWLVLGLLFFIAIFCTLHFLLGITLMQVSGIILKTHYLCLDLIITPFLLSEIMTE